MTIYTISLTNLRYIPKEWKRIYLMYSSNREVHPATPRRELTEALKAGKATRQLFLEQYRQQLESFPAYEFTKSIAEESREKTILLVGYVKDAENCQRGVLARKVKRMFPWVDYKGEWKRNG